VQDTAAHLNTAGESGATFLLRSDDALRMAPEPATDGVASDRTVTDGFGFFSP
jgi:hypothetical protein